MLTKSFCRLCLGVTGIAGMVSIQIPNIRLPTLIFMVAVLMTVLGRLQLHQMADQERARLLFGRILNASSVAAWGAIQFYLHSFCPAPSENRMFPYALAANWALTAAGISVSGLDSMHHFTFIANTVVKFSFQVSARVVSAR